MLYEHIKVSHSREEETHRLLRLHVFLGYLLATTSQVDLDCIISIHDHKGTLEICFDDAKVRHISKIIGNYSEIIEFKVRKAWEALIEFEVVFEYK